VSLPEDCGGGPSVLTASSGSIQTVGWPSTPYPLNIECTWNIECPADNVIEIDFEDPFRIAGRMPNCTRDSIKFSNKDGVIERGPFCHLTRPEPYKTISNSVQVTFDSNGIRGLTRYGFKMNYACKSTADVVEKPTVSPLCGGGPAVRTDKQGHVNTLWWSAGEAYQLNITCEWRIECPGFMRVHLEFNSRFRVAGQMPACLKDQLNIYDCNRTVTYGPFCHLTAPTPRLSMCNAVDVVFDAGDERGVSRSGFRLKYKCVSP
jgi:hypothetical protein